MGRESLSLQFDRLAKEYAAGSVTPFDVVEEVHRRIELGRASRQNAWLHVRSVDELRADARTLLARKAAGESLPLFGLPFGVKDSIDVAGMPTTVACPALSRVADESAPMVTRLVDAGAIVIGKTNMDQLASGLVGLRSPYGAPVNPFSARMIPGGSSSGSAVALAAGHVSFALGTDTAGSGRVPAAFNNVVGFKPTRGAVSMRGVAPACRSVDCFSVFTLTVGEACAVTNVVRGYDAEDPFSRPEYAERSLTPTLPSRRIRIGVPRASQREFFGDTQAEAMFDASLARFAAMECDLVDVDFTPFRQAGELLYGGPWVAERLVLGGDLLAQHPDALLPVVREILAGGLRYDALSTFSAMYRLAALRQAVLPVWRNVDTLLVPTTPTIFSVEEVLAIPLELNTKLGIYTTFANLLDLTAVAVPAGFRRDGLPSGITLLGPAGSDARIAAIADAHHGRLGGKLGATDQLHAGGSSLAVGREERIQIAVVGAHLRGQPLNHQLTDAGGTFVRGARTAAHYRLYALPGTTPPKPGLTREAEGGHAIEVEVWDLDAAAFGRFVSRVLTPLCIGSIELEDGGRVHGFLCEAHAVKGAEEISSWGGWRAYLKSRESH